MKKFITAAELKSSQYLDDNISEDESVTVRKYEPKGLVGCGTSDYSLTPWNVIKQYEKKHGKIKVFNKKGKDNKTSHLMDIDDK